MAGIALAAAVKPSPVPAHGDEGERADPGTEPSQRPRTAMSLDVRIGSLSHRLRPPRMTMKTGVRIEVPSRLPAPAHGDESGRAERVTELSLAATHDDEGERADRGAEAVFRACVWR